jgi:hypothetical protein
MHLPFVNVLAFCERNKKLFFLLAPNGIALFIIFVCNHSAKNKKQSNTKKPLTREWLLFFVRKMVQKNSLAGAHTFRFFKYKNSSLYFWEFHH